MSPGRWTAGFSLVEVMVAVVVLMVGTLMLAGGALFVTRDLVGSRLTTAAAAMSQSRLDDLRMWAAATTPRCLSPRFSSSPAPTRHAGGVRLSWVVPSAGVSRTVQIAASYPIGRGRVRADTLVGQIAC